MPLWPRYVQSRAQQIVESCHPGWENIYTSPSTILHLKIYIYKSTSTPTKTPSIPTLTPSTSTKTPSTPKAIMWQGVNLRFFWRSRPYYVVAYQNYKFEVCLPPHKTCNMILWSRFQKSSLYFSGGSDIVILL